ncbi:MAG: nuclear transport factor 2 family protein [Bacteroidota bacterium]|nr:nuclear transport factor 2 family protein [Bacteroidota bacterium]
MTIKKLFQLFVIIALISCNQTNQNQSVIKNDDELTSNIELLFDKYLENKWDGSELYAEDVVCKINNLEFSGRDNLMKGFKDHHDFLYDNIAIKEMKVYTTYFADGETWSNAWFTWTGTGKTTGNDYSNRGHFDYKWEDGKIVELLAYYSEDAGNTEAAAYAATQQE